MHVHDGLSLVEGLLAAPLLRVGILHLAVVDVRGLGGVVALL